MEKMCFSRAEYKIALNTMDLILSGEIDNPYEDTSQLEEIKEKICKYAFIRYDEIDEDIVRINMTSNELEVFSSICSYGFTLIFLSNNFDKELIKASTEMMEIASNMMDFVREKQNPNNTIEMPDYTDEMPDYTDEMLDYDENMLNASGCMLNLAKDLNDYAGASNEVASKILSNTKYIDELIQKEKDYIAQKSN